MKHSELIRTTFAQNTRITPGILRIVSKITGESQITYQQRKADSQKYYEALMLAEIKKQEKPNQNSK
jgi:hypothetical protein